MAGSGGEVLPLYTTVEPSIRHRPCSHRIGSIFLEHLMDIAKTDLLIQYILAVASRQGFGRNELRPIHFIKYVYLADLEYAKCHGGETFTGAPWRFHHFGPWAVEVFQRIEPALTAIHAEKQILESAKFGEFIQWKLEDKDLEEQLKPQLNWALTTTIDRAVREFGAGTEELLHNVYTTVPMLLAAPGESLNFLPAVVTPQPIAPPSPTVALSIKQQKRFKEKVEAARVEIKKRLATKREAAQTMAPVRAPRYDDIFFEGLAALDEAAGAGIVAGKCTCSISSEVWKSKARYDPDLS